MANKKNNSLGENLLSAANEALEWHNNKKELRKNHIIIDPPPEYEREQIIALRKKLNMSQGFFAAVLGYSDGTIKAWEQGDKVPSNSARRLLQIFDNNLDLADKFIHKAP